MVVVNEKITYLLLLRGNRKVVRLNERTIDKRRTEREMNCLTD